MLSLDALIGSLKTHEIELNEVSDEAIKNRQSIALKSTQKRTQSSKALKASEDSEEEEQDSYDDEDDSDEIAHLERKISRAWIKRKKKNLVPKKDKKGKAKQDEIICFACKEPGHVRSECPRLKKASKKEDYKEESYDGYMGGSR